MIVTRARVTSWPWHVAGRAAGFSLAELMIALIILGLGLLFIAAALPVGLEYTRQTVDLAAGEAAAEDAYNQLELNLRTSAHLYDRDIAANSNPVTIHRLDNVHRPRDQTMEMPPRFLLRPTYEPVVKVRPLVLGNIGMSQVGAGDPFPRGAELADNPELAISLYLTAVWGWGTSDPTLVRREFEFPYDNGNSLNAQLSLVRNPVLPGLARVYPPVEPVTAFTAASFFDLADNAYPTYDGRYDDPTLVNSGALYRERQKAVERRVAWTAFYRRVSYSGDAGQNGQWDYNDDRAEAPLLYELIVVVTRRTSVNHRFPRQDLSAGNLAAFEQPRALAATTLANDRVGVDRLAPTPWLVTFDSSASDALPLLDTSQYAAWADPLNGNYFERVLLNTFNDPPTLTFRCTIEVGALLPVGSIFIPAVNDQRYVPPTPGVHSPPQQVGFVPSAPESLPIYEVVERPDAMTVVVKNNGYYPWLNPSVGALNVSAFPVWVIPPAFVERDSEGQPMFERSSPILKVERRVVTLREIAP